MPTLELTQTEYDAIMKARWIAKTVAAAEMVTCLYCKGAKGWSLGPTMDNDWCACDRCSGTGKQLIYLGEVLKPSTAFAEIKRRTRDREV